jgi:hypothetical protein
MVLPRAQYLSESAEEESTDDNSINVYLPTSSAKKHLRLTLEEGMVNDNEIATPSSKKRKVLPVRAKSVKSPKGPRRIKDTIPVVEIPAKKMILDVEVKEEPHKDIASASKHHRFASEELGDDLFSTARENVAENSEDVSPVISSSEESDEAPEAIDIQEAAKTAKSKEREALQAVKG